LLKLSEEEEKHIIELVYICQELWHGYACWPGFKYAAQEMVSCAMRDVSSTARECVFVT